MCGDIWEILDCYGRFSFHLFLSRGNALCFLAAAPISFLAATPLSFLGPLSSFLAAAPISFLAATLLSFLGPLSSFLVAAPISFLVATLLSFLGPLSSFLAAMKFSPKKWMWKKFLLSMGFFLVFLSRDVFGQKQTVIGMKLISCFSSRSPTDQIHHSIVGEELHVGRIGWRHGVGDGDAGWRCFLQGHLADIRSESAGWQGELVRGLGECEGGSGGRWAGTRTGTGSGGSGGSGGSSGSGERWAGTGSGSARAAGGATIAVCGGNGDVGGGRETGQVHGLDGGGELGAYGQWCG